MGTLLALVVETKVAQNFLRKKKKRKKKEEKKEEQEEQEEQEKKRVEDTNKIRGFPPEKIHYLRKRETG